MVARANRSTANSNTSSKRTCKSSTLVGQCCHIPVETHNRRQRRVTGHVADQAVVDRQPPRSPVGPGCAERARAGQPQDAAAPRGAPPAGSRRPPGATRRARARFPLSGFEWGQLGVATADTPLRRAAAVVGVLGVTAALVAVAACVAVLLPGRGSRVVGPGPAARSDGRLRGAVPLAVSAVALIA